MKKIENGENVILTKNQFGFIVNDKTGNIEVLIPKRKIYKDETINLLHSAALQFLFLTASLTGHMPKESESNCN